jgi:purine-binding chemotaxis protein CheW
MKDAAEEAEAAVLRARARSLARRPEAAVAAAPHGELLLFRLGRERFALATERVDGVLPLAELAPLPGVPPFLRGIVNVRGRLTAVLDIQRFLALPQPGLADLHHVILLRAPDLRLGLLASAIEGVQPIPDGGLQPALPPAAGARAEFLRGLTTDGEVVLDVPRILADASLVVNEEAGG